jgi:hypothetical protein
MRGDAGARLPARDTAVSATSALALNPDFTTSHVEA